MMIILRLYYYGSVGLSGPGSKGLYGSGAAGPMKMDR
jgi:hypothetical protein